MARGIRSKAGKRNRTAKREKFHSEKEHERLLRLADLQSSEKARPYERKSHPSESEAMQVESIAPVGKPLSFEALAIPLYLIGS